MEQIATAPPSLEVWAQRRRRARQLDERYPFVSPMLRLYGALLDVQERALVGAMGADPEPVAEYAAAHVIPDVADATRLAGPPALARTIAERLRDEDATTIVAAWLADSDQLPVDRYLARAAATPVLMAWRQAGAPARARGRADNECPRCGSLPQVSYLSDAGEALVSGPRMLSCCRCEATWAYQRMTCVGCGEQSSGKLPIFADAERFAHLRADACETCRRYVITVDLRKDPAAVPIIDELAALPLDLYVQERGFAKIVPNLMAIG
jgi:FdhE protein